MKRYDEENKASKPMNKEAQADENKEYLHFIAFLMSENISYSQIEDSWIMRYFI